MAEFQYDVFLSYSSKETGPWCRELAERLRGDGLRVWFDEREIRPGDPIPKRIEDGSACFPHPRAVHVSARVPIRVDHLWKVGHSASVTRLTK